MSDRLLTEIQRQEKYLAKLPPNFTFPLFNAKQALLSQRASSYRDTASAAREIIDNAMEAGATRIHVVMDEEHQGRRSGSVQSIAFIDNGPGMRPKMAQYALSWGGGTHFDDPTFIGRFGFGLPNASISQSRRTEVYTRVAGQDGFTQVNLDIRDYDEFENQTIPPPIENAELPEYVASYLKRIKMPLENGTVVVWAAPDKISSRSVAKLRDKLLDDFGVTYRYLLQTKSGETERPAQRHIELVVAGTQVAPIDPLFLLPEGRYFKLEDEGGAIPVYEKDIPVCLKQNLQTGEQRLRLVNATDFEGMQEDERGKAEPNQDEKITYGIIHVQVARFPYGFSDGRSQHVKEVKDEHRRFEIRKTRRGISFVRAGREIDTSSKFPQKSSDEHEGLGQWPQQLMYALNWGAEVRFSPELDDVFGVTHDKQSVRPVEDFWRVMAAEGVDDILRAQQARLSKEERDRGEAKAKTNTDEMQGPTPAEVASKNAVEAEGGSGPRVPDYQRPDLQKRFEESAVSQAEETGRDIEVVRQAFEREIKARPFILKYVDERHAPFYEPEWSDRSQVVVKINRLHPFFSELYVDLTAMHGGDKVKQVVDLLLIALARAELEAETKDMHEWYVKQREDRWSPFLKTAVRSLRSMQDIVKTGSDEEDSEPSARDNVNAGTQP